MKNIGLSEAVPAFISGIMTCPNFFLDLPIGIIAATLTKGLMLDFGARRMSRRSDFTFSGFAMFCVYFPPPAGQEKPLTIFPNIQSLI